MRSIVAGLLGLYGRLRLRGRVRIAAGPGTKLRLERIAGVPNCRVEVGRDSIVNARISFDRPGAAFRAGDRCFIGASHVVLASAVSLGNDVIISWGVTIVDHNSHAVAWIHRAMDVLDWKQGRKDWTHVQVAPVTIEDEVWIGFNAIILKGVTIGRGAIVAAGAVVTKDVAPRTIVAGNPARPVRAVAEDET